MVFTTIYNKNADDNASNPHDGPMDAVQESGDAEHEETDASLQEFTAHTPDALSAMIGDDTVSIAKRTRLLYYLRHVYDHTKDGLKHVKRADVIPILSYGFKSGSSLLRHEVAYVLGQLGSNDACDILSDVLGNTSEDCMVRHEAGEALGAIGDTRSLETLHRYLQDPVREVRETCELAIANIEYANLRGKQDKFSEDFESIDPAPAIRVDEDEEEEKIENENNAARPSKKEKKHYTTEELRQRYLDTNLSLFERYRAMFALRNRVSQNNDLDALHALCEGFRDEEGALFKHEVAFVLGQLQRQESADTLVRVLQDVTQHDMVRHEAAEALGSIADPETLQLLEQFQKDHAPAVSDSCVVAVDMHNFWTADK